MSDQYTPSVGSSQAYLVTLHQEIITRQEQEITRLRTELARAQFSNLTLSQHIRDLEFDITMHQPRQKGIPPPLVLSGITKTEQVRRLAAARGVSVSTMWRRVQSGEEKLED